MAVSKLQQKCVTRYVASHYDRINVTMSNKKDESGKSKKERMKDKADLIEMSVNEFINFAIDEALDHCSANRKKEFDDIEIETAKKTAKELNCNIDDVFMAAEFANAVDRVDGIVSGFKNDVLNGKLHASKEDIILTNKMCKQVVIAWVEKLKCLDK